MGWTSYGVNNSAGERRKPVTSDKILSMSTLALKQTSWTNMSDFFFLVFDANLNDFCLVSLLSTHSQSENMVVKNADIFE